MYRVYIKSPYIEHLGLQVRGYESSGQLQGKPLSWKNRRFKNHDFLLRIRLYVLDGSGNLQSYDLGMGCLDHQNLLDRGGGLDSWGKVNGENRDPFIGSLQSLYNWGSIISYIPYNQPGFFFIAQFVLCDGIRIPKFFVPSMLFAHMWVVAGCFHEARGGKDCYTPENKHGTWKWTPGKGETSTNHQFLGSMFVFQRVKFDLNATTYAKKKTVFLSEHTLFSPVFTVYLSCCSMMHLPSTASWKQFGFLFFGPFNSSLFNLGCTSYHRNVGGPPPQCHRPPEIAG